LVIFLLRHAFRVDVVVRTAIATAIVVAIADNVIAEAIFAYKVVEKTHWYPPWLVGMGLTYELNYKDASTLAKIVQIIFMLTSDSHSRMLSHNQQGHQ